MSIDFPKKLQNNQKGCNFLINVYLKIIYQYDNNVILNFTETRVFDTSLLVFIDLVENECRISNKKIKAILPNGDQVIQKNISNILFDIYATNKSSFFKPRCIVGNSNLHEVESLLIKDLKILDLQEYDKIKIIISEIKANIQMHVADEETGCKGYISAYHDVANEKIIVSIANNIRSIKETLALKKMLFSDELAAISWCLKKKNSTRKEEETGGLGLYLLRKYLSEIGGEMSIISGNTYVSLKRQLYNLKDENDFKFEDVDLYKNNLLGTIFVIEFFYKVSKEEKIKNATEEIGLINFLERTDGMY